MITMMKRILLAATLCVATASVSMIAGAQDSNETFTIINHSNYRITHMYVSPTSYTRWGYDRLGDDVLPPNYRTDLSVTPGWYDVKLIDEDGDACVINNVDFRDGKSWTVTNALLLACEVFSHN